MIVMLRGCVQCCYLFVKYIFLLNNLSLIIYVLFHLLMCMQIIIRPADVFGHEDKFLNYIGTASERMPIIPLTNYGRTKCQPVHSSDIGVAVNRIINVS
jgi:hypothetical protein